MKTKGDAAFNGVVVLTAALILVKVLSALYRVSYQNILGDHGLYAYQQIYPVVALGAILSMNAIPSAVTQIFEGSIEGSRYTRVLLWAEVVSIAFFVMIYLCSERIAQAMGDANLAPMFKVASFSFMFIGALGVLRGYYQSQQQMTLPAFSQVVEQFVRVAMIFVAIWLYAKAGWTVYAAGSVAIGGSALGFFSSTALLALQRPFSLSFNSSSTALPWRRFFVAIIIFALSQLLVILWQIVDNFSIIHLLQRAGLSFNQATAQKGIYERGASFIQMGLNVTTTFSFVLIPLLTRALKDGQHHLARRYTMASLKITIAISSAAGIGLINLVPLLNTVFFKNNSLVLTLSVYMLTVICVSLLMMDIALLQVRNYESRIIGGIGVGLLLKAVGNFILVPSLHMLGAGIATVLSLGVAVLILHSKVIEAYRLRGMVSFVLKLSVALIAMSGVVQVVMWTVPYYGRLTGLFTLLGGALLGVLVLVWLIVKLRILTYKELKYLPFGDKLYSVRRGRRT